MILVITRIKALPEKRVELLQKFAAMAGSIRMEKGCQHCESSQSIEDDHCKEKGGNDHEYYKLIIIVVVLVLLFGGGGGYYWRRRR